MVTCKSPVPGPVEVDAMDPDVYASAYNHDNCIDSPVVLYGSARNIPSAWQSIRASRPRRIFTRLTPWRRAVPNDVTSVKTVEQEVPVGDARFIRFWECKKREQSTNAFGYQCTLPPHYLKIVIIFARIEATTALSDKGDPGHRPDPCKRVFLVTH
jgi:hypothetical protein